MKNLETFESASQSLGIEPTLLPIVDHLPEEFQKAQIAAYKLFILSKASWKQEAKEIDWYNLDQRKYYPWFDMSSERLGSSVGFSPGVYDYVSSGSYVGSRLVFPTREIAEYVGKTHINLYRDLMVIE